MKLQKWFIPFIVCASFACKDERSENKRIIEGFLYDLRRGLSGDSIWKRHIVEDTNRLPTTEALYKDSLFPNIKRQTFDPAYTILSLREVRGQYKKDEYVEPYIKSQVDNIYLCIPSKGGIDQAIYFLVVDGKIYSTYPAARIQGKIFNWY
jgi:hypothetical protein